MTHTTPHDAPRPHARDTAYASHALYASCSSYDGTRLSYAVTGCGEPLVCLPGGPLQAAAYLGDLGGLTASRTLITLDLRGTGRSAVPRDPATYRCDRLVADVEALRAHLGADRLDLLAHSAGANLALLYTARHPDRVRRLVLVAPSVLAVGVPIGERTRRDVAEARRGEPWYPAASRALEAVFAGRAEAADLRAVSPFWYGSWGEEARAHAAAADRQRNAEAAAVYAAEGAFDPTATRAALARLPAPVLALAGELDLNSPPLAVAELAGLVRDSEFRVQAGAAHFPWLDDPAAFTTTVEGFLRT
ncbi:alpha/beta fold hydrolase [Streptomyces sp. Da 82-17]|uniref:alpha/beta fold hydrolase n=1 Tax=Streptomyces sp. Da 82-17 TaxID=3377116 RepID=UPI0038D509A8